MYMYQVKAYYHQQAWKELIQQILRTNKREIKLHDGHVALARGQYHGSKKHFAVILGTTYTVRV